MEVNTQKISNKSAEMLSESHVHRNTAKNVNGQKSNSVERARIVTLCAPLLTCCSPRSSVSGEHLMGPVHICLSRVS